MLRIRLRRVGKKKQPSYRIVVADVRAPRDGAIVEQVGKGTHFGANHRLELAWGQHVKELVPCAEEVRFTSSGTEATLMAIRLARAHTGRDRLLKFDHHFHG